MVFWMSTGECEALGSELRCVAQKNMVLVMDLMERGDLYHLLDRRDKQGRQVFSFIHRGRRVAREIALGLCFLHSLRQVPHWPPAAVIPCRRGRGVVEGSTSTKVL